jgi:hypothetical protein
MYHCPLQPQCYVSQMTAAKNVPQINRSLVGSITDSDGAPMLQDIEGGRCDAMSESGQSRHFERAPITSGLPPTADILRVIRHVAKVPEPKVKFSGSSSVWDAHQGHYSTLQSPQPGRTTCKVAWYSQCVGK